MVFGVLLIRDEIEVGDLVLEIPTKENYTYDNKNVYYIKGVDRINDVLKYTSFVYMNKCYYVNENNGGYLSTSFKGSEFWSYEIIKKK